MWAYEWSNNQMSIFHQPFFHGHIKLLTVSVFGRCIYQNLTEAMEKCIFVEIDALSHDAQK